MTFLIVNNLINQIQNTDILNICQRANLNYHHVNAIKINGNLAFLMNGIEVNKILNKNESYLTLGSYSLATLLKNSGFIFGHNLDNLAQNIQMKKWNSKFFLNSDNQIVNKNNIQPFNGELFFRPLNDSKVFSAGIYDFNKIVKLNFNEDLLMSSIKKINAEYRFIIIKKQIADNSSYKIGNRINISSKAPESFNEFVEDLIKVWVPTENFVIDMAEIDGRPKIIEVNNIHCSRFYGCSIEKVMNKFLEI